MNVHFIKEPPIFIWMVRQLFTYGERSEERKRSSRLLMGAIQADTIHR